MRVNRSRLNWGVFFIVLGAIPLLANIGLLNQATVTQLASLWPLVLIALGIGLLLRFSRSNDLGGLIIAATLGLVFGAIIAGGASAGVGIGCTGSGGGTAVTDSGALAQGGRISAELSCVDLTVDSQAGDTWSVSAGADSNRQPIIEHTGNLVTLRSNPERFFGPGPRLPWHITLPQAASLTLDLTANVATGDVNVGAAQLTSIGYTLNASDVDFNLTQVTTLRSIGATLNAASSTLVLPSTSGALDGGLTLNASSLTICAAPTTNLLVELNETLSSNNFAAAGLVKSGEQWVTPGAVAGAPLVSVHMSNNVSTVTLDRTGECR